MPTDPNTVHLLKYIGDSIAINRTVKVIDDMDNGLFRLSVSDRDYTADPNGKNVTIVHRVEYKYRADADAAMEKHVELSLADGFKINTLSGVPY
jgi:hypothetical protein